MKGKIGFEETFAIKETLEFSRAFAGESGNWGNFSRQILDLDEERLEIMNKNGIEYALLSLNSPGVQAILNPDKAMRIAKKANDTLAYAISKYPQHYGGMATLPLHNPDMASEELIRCVKELGFKGIMVNGFQQIVHPDHVKFYDFPEYRSFWATVSELEVPFYLHPRMPIPSRSQNYDGHPWLMSAPWGFGVETSIHSLRLCGSGLFDDYPNLRICLGHLGETIPFALNRLEERMLFSPRGYRGKRPIGDYFRDHFHLTCSGNFNDAAFRCTLNVIDHDKIYFSTDYPFETMEDAASWFDNTKVISNETREKIGRTHAINLFKLDLE
ncbi:amidohydrolase family protein [Xanthovirga aplysinae]|uniref:amidohydrolase family protein n=1 Tax=Xanthovirga aplysinae TaxID=2529853 RepID=UPI0012BD577D|nr:amidohydrolase family protein [Xanthovirga aplysinae]MTI31401.1 amidohydrolase [Xanthovirga aplysinae]